MQLFIPVSKNNDLHVRWHLFIVCIHLLIFLTDTDVIMTFLRYFVALLIPFNYEDKHLAVPSHRLSTYGRRAFAIAGPTTWNSLPTHLRRVENSTAAFGRLLKTHLLSEY